MSDSGNAASGPSCSGFRSGPERTGSAEQSRVWSLSSSSQRGRLPSLRTRDLTLGGPLFDPATFPRLQTENPVAPKKEKRERDAKRKESRGGRKVRPQVIQSHSIFEQCPGVSNYRTGGSSASPVCRPMKKEGKNSTEDEDHLLSKLQRDDLPLLTCCSAGQDDLLVLTAPPCGADGKAALLTDWQKSEQLSLVKMLQELSVSGGEELFFMQFPDCLPGRHSAPKADLHHGGATEKPSKTDTKSAQQESRNMDGSLVLSEFPEGFLGKLQIRKSGKVELKLGDIILDVSEGAAFSFLQQLVSVRLSGGRTGNMMVLGNVHHKLVLSPDFQSLLRQVAAQHSRSTSKP
uniref:Zgc:171971 n=1 Tax=Poecilia latipinna TaxID=48699 RepID=A0A3B3TP33_9TELE